MNYHNLPYDKHMSVYNADEKNVKFSRFPGLNFKKLLVPFKKKRTAQITEL